MMERQTNVSLEREPRKLVSSAEREKVRMKFNIPTELYEDEVVGFLADRYHSTPQEIVLCFLAQDGRTEDADKKAISFTLEENEMKIMRDLTKRAMEK